MKSRIANAWALCYKASTLYRKVYLAEGQVLKTVVNRVAAGVAAPVLSMLFNQAGTALYQHDPLWLQSVWTMLLAAAIFGAPLSVPIALLIPLRNVWRGVPLIALAAAIGYGLEDWFSGPLESAHAPSQVQVFFTIVMVLPALFGTIAALVLRFQQNFSIAAAPLAVALAAAMWFAGNAEARAIAPAHAQARVWSVLRVGMMGFTGGNKSGQIVCPTLSAYLNSDRSSRQRCRVVGNATPVIVDAIIPPKRTDPDRGWEGPPVQIHARNGSWKGFTDASDLQPDVQPGTFLHLEGDWGALEIVDDRGVSTDIGGSALARLVRYDPKRSYSLYVEIIDGYYRGKRGWTAIQDVDTGAVALGQYSLQYPE